MINIRINTDTEGFLSKNGMPHESVQKMELARILRQLANDVAMPQFELRDSTIYLFDRERQFCGEFREEKQDAD